MNSNLNFRFLYYTSKKIIFAVDIYKFMLSVLIPVYNYNITELVTTIHKEAVALGIRFEIQILEDGSTLYTEHNQVLSNLENVYYNNNTTNLGRTATRQSLAKHANYNRLLFLDADVLPVEKNFLTIFLKQDDTYNLVIGGTKYLDEYPDSNYSLRWKFGRERETKTAEERQKAPYLSIISSCLYIDKETFLQVNDDYKDAYGMDIYFSYKLKKEQFSVLHIDNPVYHLGLETNSIFLPKSFRAIDTLLSLEKTEKIPKDYSKLQRTYFKLKGMGLVTPISLFLQKLQPLFEKNLKGPQPKLLYFDLYRLSYYLKQKNA